MAANGVKEATLLFSELSMSEPLPIDIVSPSGKHIALMMRTLKADEITDVRRSMSARPQAPVGDIRRNAQGQIERVRNEEDPTYVAAVDEYNQRFGVRCLFRSLVGLQVPGETEPEQMEHFERSIDAWALSQLMDHFNRINGFTNESFATARAELTPLEDASTPSLPDSDGDSKSGNGSTSRSKDAS
jgi:hypothetical protein